MSDFDLGVCAGVTVMFVWRAFSTWMDRIGREDRDALLTKIGESTKSTYEAGRQSSEAVAKGCITALESIAVRLAALEAAVRR